MHSCNDSTHLFAVQQLISHIGATCLHVIAVLRPVLPCTMEDHRHLPFYLMRQDGSDGNASMHDVRVLESDIVTRATGTNAAQDGACKVRCWTAGYGVLWVQYAGILVFVISTRLLGLRLLLL